MTARQRGAPRVGLCRGLLTSSIGIAHLVRPEVFEPMNVTLGFTENTRMHVYINGAIETSIGLSMMLPGTRRLTPIAGIGYITYLVAHVVRSRRTS